MLQWIKKSPVALPHLAVLLVAIYFCVFQFSVWTGLIALALFLIFIKRVGKQKIKRVFPILLVFSSLFVGYHVYTTYQDKTSPSTISQIQIIPDSIRVNGDKLSFRGKAAGRTYPVYYQLTSQEEQEFFQNLTQPLLLTVEAEVSEASSQRNFNGFDYQRYLFYQGMYQTVSISQIKKMTKVKSLNPFDWLAIWRRQALVAIRNHFPNPMRHYMTGLLFGDLDTEFEEMEDIYSSLGIIHLFALSGMQVGFFVDKWRRLFLRFGLKKETVDWLQIPFSILYAGFTGGSVSVLRSLVQKLVGNQGLRGLDNLAVTLAICFFISPYFLLTAGGVLSFLYAFLLTVFDFERLSPIKAMLAESLALSLGILPVLMVYFYSFQPLSILLTFLLSFLFDVLFLPLLSILFLLMPLYAVTQVNFLFVFLENILTWVASHSFSSLIFGKPSLILFLLLCLVLAILHDFRKKRKIVLTTSIAFIGLLFLVKHPLVNEVTIVDVGQGDSIFLRDMAGKTILIDVGGKVSFEEKEDWRKAQSDSNAERTLIPYLKSRGVAKIDQLVLTHTDTDHVGDLLVVAQELDIGEIVVSPGSLTKTEFVETLKEIKAPVRVVKAGDSLSIMSSSLQVLSPFETGDGGNNDSIVLYGKLLNKRFLLTGDLEEAGEKKVLEAYPDLQADILKLGHHGSKGSSSQAFLEQVAPSLALISVGKNNRYQHPHQETLDRLEMADIPSLRTDQNGAIRFFGTNSWHLETVQ